MPVGTPGGPVGTRRRSRPRVGCRTGEECSPVRQCPIMPHVSVPGRQGRPRSAVGTHQAASSFVACLLDGAPSGRRRLPGSGRGGVRGLPPPPAGEAHQRCRRRGYPSGHGRCRRSSGRGPRRPVTGRPALGGLPIPGCRPRRGCAGWSRGVVLELCGHKHGEDVPRPGERLRWDAGFQPCQAELERRSHAGALVSDNCPLPKNILHNMPIPGRHARARLLLRG
ncbi:protein of unknown function [Streptomyces sp. KY75]|nr:protein of unknown function [Streptomyces sp. KY75]CAD5991375.1 protein of unknown function [Streptomyces sp. KY70]